MVTQEKFRGGGRGGRGGGQGPLLVSCTGPPGRWGALSATSAALAPLALFCSLQHCRGGSLLYNEYKWFIIVSYMLLLMGIDNDHSWCSASGTPPLFTSRQAERMLTDVNHCSACSEDVSGQSSSYFHTAALTSPHFKGL